MKVILLVGLPGSGKSELAKSYKSQGFEIINQDTLGSRSACLSAMREALNNNKDVLIDRTNINKKQRSYFIAIAKEFGIIDIECINLTVDTMICVSRIHSRENHPTIKSDMTFDKKMEIVHRFARDYEKPELGEGFNVISFIDNNRVNNS